METVNTITEVRNLIKEWRRNGLSIGFVPTMGYLHEGHKSLIERAFKENDKVVVSIFVNPIQFGPNEDLESYPRDLEKDKVLCSLAGADLIFNPSPIEMYGENACTYVEVQGITNGLCGEKRPGHFKGVCTVVSKLFNIVNPNRAYFGEKDAQQLAVIKKMVEDLNIDIEIIGCPIIREVDGLAKSSRNTYLSSEEREAALILNKSLCVAKESLLNGQRNADILKDQIIKNLKSEVFAKIDYVAVVDSLSLEPLSIIEKPTLVAIAVYIGKTRLIDNFSFKF
jgi:pantoate--beta-alanine ligase